MNNDNFLIKTNDIELAQDKVSCITDPNIRNRAMANILGAMVASECIPDSDIDSGIHNAIKVLKDVDVSDVYINGNYIDARITFNENELYVPKSHFDMGMLPVAYMFIRLDKDLSSGNIIGFIFPEDVDTNVDINGYYKVEETLLKSFYDVESRIVTVDDEDLSLTFQGEVFDYLDGKILGQNLYKTLVASNLARKYFLQAAGIDCIFNSFDFDKLSNIEIPETGKLLNDDIELVNTDFAESGDMESDFNGNLEPIESMDSELMEFEDIEENNLPEASYEFSDDLEPENDIELLNEPELNTDLEEPSEDTANDAWMEDSDKEYDNITSAEDDDNENLTPNRISEGAEKLELAEEEPVEEAIVEELVENSEFDSSIESSGQLERSIPPQNPVRARVVMIDDEPAQNPGIDSETDKEFEELSKFDYSTEIMPSISSIESENQISEQVTEESLASAGKKYFDNDMKKSSSSSENGEQIENLFGQNPHKTVNTSKRKGSPLPLLGFLVILGVLGYYGYTKFYSPLPDVINNNTSEVNYENEITSEEKEKKNEVAMPVETVENVQMNKNKNEASSVSIPAIEQNLNASIDVSNLSVNWEVPLAYANNTTAKRYFVKIGKILQLNLKTELLFLSSSPITNKISIELEFDKTSNKFAISKFANSSGVVNIDNVIRDTVEKALNMNLSTNMTVFKNLQGNPVLVIKL